MEKKLIAHCPRCNEELVATRLTCNECELELTGDFALSRFNYLSNEEMDFILTFLKYQGNFKVVQERKGMSYPAVKKKLAQVTFKLGIADLVEQNKEEVDIPKLNYLTIEDSDSAVVTKIKEKLNSLGGRATIKLYQGDPCDIWFDVDATGLVSPKIPPAKQLIWEAFDAAVEIVIKNGGKAVKGKARSGAKLGSKDLSLDSVEGYIAHKVHNVQEGETAFGPGFVIAAILDWAEICHNERGYLRINPEFNI